MKSCFTFDPELCVRLTYGPKKFKRFKRTLTTLFIRKKVTFGLSADFKAVFIDEAPK
jgi:hypothetical protein